MIEFEKVMEALEVNLQDEKCFTQPLDERLREIFVHIYDDFEQQLNECKKSVAILENELSFSRQCRDYDSRDYDKLLASWAGRGITIEQKDERIAEFGEYQAIVEIDSSVAIIDRGFHLYDVSSNHVLEQGKKYHIIVLEGGEL